DDREMDFEAEESIEWAIDDLRATYVHRQVSDYNKRLAVAMAEAAPEDRVQVVADAASEIVMLTQSMESHDTAIDAREALVDLYRDYERRGQRNGQVDGMTFGTGMD